MRIYFHDSSNPNLVTNIGPDSVPGFDLVTDGTVVVDDSTIVAIGMIYDGTAFAYPIPDLDTLQTKISSDVDAALNAVFQNGFSPSSGPLSGHILQVRNTEDRTNWLTSKDAYRDAIAADLGASQGAYFRTAANENITCTFQEGFDCLQQMATWITSMMSNSWVLKDRIKAAQNADDLLVIDITTGW